MKPASEPDFLKLVEIIKGDRAEEKRETLEARILSTILQLAEKRDDQGNLFLRNNKISVRAITDHLNEGGPEKYPISPNRVGRVVKSLGLERGILHGGPSAVVWHETTILQIAEAYGVKKNLTNVTNLSVNE